MGLVDMEDERMIQETDLEKIVVSEQVNSLYNVLVSNTQVEKALSFLKDDNDHTTEEQIELTAIEAPTFMEETKGKYYKKKLEELGILDITVDEVGNVFGIRPGSGGGPKLVVCAHLDTVFPLGTDVVAKRIDGKVYAPGIADDGRGLAAVLSLTRALNDANIHTNGDLIIGATVGEEGLGDLRGVKTLFKNRDDIDGFISVEPGEPNRITYLGTGSKRFKITYQGPGGHSFGAFGTPNPIHAMGRAIAKIADIETPSNPKTTFNVGVIEGGTSINTISEKAEMFIDLRSNSQDELKKLEDKVLEIIAQAKDEENHRWKSDEITVTIEQVGDRPAGSQSPDSIIVQAAAAAAASLGFEPDSTPASSTDSNIPISLGIPAVTLGGGGDFGGIHTLNEYFDPKDAYTGVQNLLLTVLGLVGIDGVSEALLSKKENI